MIVRPLANGSISYILVVGEIDGVGRLHNRARDGLGWLYWVRQREKIDACDESEKYFHFRKDHNLTPFKLSIMNYKPRLRNALRYALSGLPATYL